MPQQGFALHLLSVLQFKRINKKRWMMENYRGGLPKTLCSRVLGTIPVTEIDFSRNEDLQQLVKTRKFEESII